MSELRKVIENSIIYHAFLVDLMIVKKEPNDEFRLICICFRFPSSLPFVALSRVYRASGLDLVGGGLPLRLPGIPRKTLVRHDLVQ